MGKHNSQIIHLYLPGELSIQSAYFLRQYDTNCLQMPILAPNCYIAEISYSSKLISIGKSRIVLGQDLLSFEISNGASGIADLANNLVLSSEGLSVRFEAIDGQLADLQLGLKFIDI